MFEFLTTLKAFLAENQRLKKDFTPRTLFENQYVLQVLKEFQNPQTQ